MTHHEDSLLDKAKRMLGMGGDDHSDHGDHGHDDHAGHDHAADDHGDHADVAGGHPRDAELHPTAPDAGVSDAARDRSLADDPAESPGTRANEFSETGAASGPTTFTGTEDRSEVDRRTEP